MIWPADLARWNRSGLSRFRYVNGNAAVYLDVLRAALSERFPQWVSLRVPDVEDEADDEFLDRLLSQYEQVPVDPGWEMARVLARACHVLTEHIDAFANEGYIDTATRWESLRRLVGMLGYHPAPPASATTWLVLCAPDGRSGTLERGFAVKHSPEDGGPPVVFETLDDLDLDAAANAVRLLGHDSDPRLYADIAGTDEERRIWRVDAGEEPLPSVGDLGLVIDTSPATPRAAAVDLVGATVEEQECLLSLATFANQPSWRDWVLGAMALHVGAAKIRSPRLNGSDAVQTEGAHGLAADEVIAWQGGDGSWSFGTVLEADKYAMRLRTADALPANGAAIYRTVTVSNAVTISADFKEGSLARRAAQGHYRTFSGYTILSEDPAQQRYGRKVSLQVQPNLVVYVPTNFQAVAVVIETDQELEFDGKPGNLATAQWVLLECRDGSFRARRIAKIRTLESTFRLAFENGAAGPPEPGAATALAARPAQIVQGVGERYAARLAAAGVHTVSDLAHIDPATLSVDISRTRLWEFRGMARVLLRFADLVRPLGSLGRRSPGAIAAMGLDAIAGEGRLSMSQAEKIRDDARELRALLDEPAFETARLEDGEADGAPAAGPGSSPVVRMYGPFAHEIRPRGYAENPTPLTGSELELSEDEVPAVLGRGRVVVLERADSGTSRRFTVGAVRGDGGRKAIVLREGVDPADGFTVGNCIVRGNVVRAGHGEVQKEKVLGSGNAAQSFQEFLLDAQGVSFEPDAAQPTGVRASIALEVDGQTWQPVGSLWEAAATDNVYTVRMTREGKLIIGAGDGRHGRRFPTGENNLRCTYRKGNGLAGNLPAGSLTKPKKPHPLVEAVTQPFESAGGNDMEDTESLRRNAPASVLALERAVSLADFTHLAASQSSVWQARAVTGKVPVGGFDAVSVAVVPAGGGELGDLADTLRQFLIAHALPGVRISVQRYQKVAVGLRVAIAVDADAYDPETVEVAVRSALEDKLSLARRKLGQALYRSVVYRIVEAVEGVENSSCEILGASAEGPPPVEMIRGRTQKIEVVRVGECQLVCVDPDVWPIDLLLKEYRP